MPNHATRRAARPATTTGQPAGMRLPAGTIDTLLLPGGTGVFEAQHDEALISWIAGPGHASTGDRPRGAGSEGEESSARETIVGALHDG